MKEKDNQDIETKKSNVPEMVGEGLFILLGEFSEHTHQLW